VVKTAEGGLAATAPPRACVHSDGARNGPRTGLVLDHRSDPIVAGEAHSYEVPSIGNNTEDLSRQKVRGLGLVSPNSELLRLSSPSEKKGVSEGDSAPTGDVSPSVLPPRPRDTSGGRKGGLESRLFS
jgi:hypothetical protein